MNVQAVTPTAPRRRRVLPRVPRVPRVPHLPRGRRGRRGRLTAALAVLVTLLMLLHGWVPDSGPHLGSLVETFLPWTAAAVVALLAAALLRRSRMALAAAALPAVTWAGLHGGTFLDRAAGGPADLTVVTHNVDDVNPDPAGTARALAASGAQLIALEELTPPALGTYEQTLAATHPYHAVAGTVGLWSTHPLRDTAAVPLVPWRSALRTTADTPQGPLTVYVAHLPSVRLRLGSGFTTDRRNEAADRLAAELDSAPAGRVLLLGDFNGTTGDRALAPVTGRFRSAQEVAGAGFGFTWPARFPVARIDQILVRDLTPVAAWTLPATASDHLPVAASLRR
ncbi:endonuclease/exonuclease/phosphatase family protein [Streptomyces sp. NPDC048349]|uniref:endonuclease/exonuclease/phosphatase family protein n=1 Tax=Streptomyces sp. NPDC048349 TaxID=3155486 RepID=UPI003446DC48